MKTFVITKKFETMPLVKIRYGRYLVENTTPDAVFDSLELKFHGDEYLDIRLTSRRLAQIGSGRENYEEEEKLRAPFCAMFGLVLGAGLNYIALSNLGGDPLTPRKVRQFILLFHQVEPLPRQVLDDLTALGIDLSLLTINPIESAANVQEAIAKARDAHDKGYPEKFAELANYYAEKQQLSEWIAVIHALPKSNAHFKELNQALLEYYNSLPEAGSVPLLIDRFKAAYHAGLTRESACYFSELAGEGLSTVVTLDAGESSADILIQLALALRKKNEEIAALKARLDPTHDQEPTPKFFKP